MKKYGWIIVVVVVMALAVYMYANVANHVCPYCHGVLEYQDKIFSEGKTLFRYTCENSPLHIVDSYIKF